VLGVGLLAGSAAWAQTAAAPPESKTTQSATDSQFDISDLIRAVLHKPAPDNSDEQKPKSGTIAPIIGYSPSTALTFGVAGQRASRRGDPGTTSLSSLVTSLTFSTKKQTELFARFALFTENDRWFVEGDNRFLWTSQDAYGLGTSSTPASRLNMRYDYFRVSETMYRAIGRRVFGGVGFHFGAHTNVRPGEDAEAAFDQSPYIAYSTEHGFPLDSQQSVGVSLNVLADRRDNPINATRGWRASSSYRAFIKGLLGGDSDWQELNVDARAYRAIDSRARQVLAFWLFSDFVVGGVAPYLDLPSTGMDTSGRSGRGYGEGRFRGERLMYGEIEYRATVTSNGLIGLVAFLNTTTVTNLETGERLFDSFAPGGGAGLRLLLNKRSRTNVCVDVGFGKQRSHGLYLGVQEAF